MLFSSAHSSILDNLVFSVAVNTLFIVQSVWLSVSRNSLARTSQASTQSSIKTLSVHDKVLFGVSSGKAILLILIIISGYYSSCVIYI